MNREIIVFLLAFLVIAAGCAKTDNLAATGKNAAQDNADNQNSQPQESREIGDLFKESDVKPPEIPA